MSSVVRAKALYNNDSEADDELSFKKGDIVHVIETDFEGMLGWWLCSLGDKQGVAPGNRLQLISIDDDAMGPYDAHGNAWKESYGDVDYDIPKSYSQSEPEDYATPKSDSQRHGLLLPSPQAVNAERNSNTSDGLATNETYAAPSLRYSSERSSDEFRLSSEMSHGSGSDEMYDVQSRNSLESDDGQQPNLPPKSTNTSYNSPSSSRYSNQSDSPYSSLNSHELYDRLPAHELYDRLPGNELYDRLPGNDLYDRLPGNDMLYDKLPNHETYNDDTNRTVSVSSQDYVNMSSSSFNSTKDLYDVLPSTYGEDYTFPEKRQQLENTKRTISVSSQDYVNMSSPTFNPTQDIYDVLPAAHDEVDSFPDRRSAQRLADGNNNPTDDKNGIYREIHEKTESYNSSTGEKKSGSLKSNKNYDSDDYIDYQEIYGMGDNSEISKNNQGQMKESVLGKINMAKVRELQISHGSALQKLHKLQQAVDVAVTKLLSFVTDDWRRPEVYALNMNGIRDISGKVKVALRLLTEFGLNSLKNSQNLGDEETSKKIEGSLTPLLESYYSIKNAIQQLDESNWRSAYQETSDDNLNTIVNLARCIPSGAYYLGAIVSNVASRLFTEKTSDGIVKKEMIQNIVKQKTVSNSPEMSIVHPDATFIVATKDTSSKTEVKNSNTTHSLNGAGAFSSSTHNENVLKVAMNKTSSEHVGDGIETQLVLQSIKIPTPVQSKPKRDKNRSDSGSNTLVASSVSCQNPSTSNDASTEALSQQVSELTNNLLNQIDTVKPSTHGFTRKGSKRLSPKTVRRLCSITLKDDDKIGDRIFENNASIPPKPSRQNSSPVTPTNFDNKRLSLTGTMSDPSFTHSRISDENRLQTLESSVEKMNCELIVLKEAIRGFGDSVRDHHKPKDFVAHSKFIVLSAHKLVFIGDGVSLCLQVDDGRVISSLTNTLCEVINAFVESIKIAAQHYPEENAMNNMIKNATNVTEKALGLYSSIKRLTRNN
ncbi:enhancer of filamentation 1-like isoform X2 [Xenia sp. Carnegie-2017]|uniref:enhancer of filamentation 1-like isoform X2 n=1 Tax=Xenia sp. Carnegie-2017 TaxID=2897299 RepID=UPI001F03484E|nr:enhancer of filamentation 1-like isoform X2 [Xenia sp. Carnegie-2017]